MIVNTIAAVLVAASAITTGYVTPVASRAPEPPKKAEQAPKNCGQANTVLTDLSNQGFRITWSGKFETGMLVIGQVPESARWVAVLVAEPPNGKSKIACILQTGDSGKVAGEVI